MVEDERRPAAETRSQNGGIPQRGPAISRRPHGGMKDEYYKYISGVSGEVVRIANVVQSYIHLQVHGKMRHRQRSNNPTQFAASIWGSLFQWRLIR